MDDREPTATANMSSWKVWPRLDTIALPITVQCRYTSHDPDYKRDKGVPFKPDCVTCENMVDNNGIAACNTDGCIDNRRTR